MRNQEPQRILSTRNQRFISVSSAFHLWLIIISFLICGCDKKETSPSVVLATVNGRAVTQADFDAEYARRKDQPPAAVLSNLIERQAMLIKAEAAGIADSPEFKRETENRLVSQWLANTFNKERDAVSVSEEELKAAYEMRREQLFLRKPLTRYAILCRKGKNLDELKNTLAEAVAVFEKDRDGATNKGRLQGFGKIAADYSEDTGSRYRGGDIGWVGENVLPRIPAEVIDIAKDHAVGKIAGPVVAGDGVYVVMKTGEREASQIDYKEASPALRRRVLSEKRAEVEQAFRENVMRNVTVIHKAAPVVVPSVKKQDELPSFPSSVNE
jgi:parvulin-like peptidyl-prolyl isomerase